MTRWFFTGEVGYGFGPIKIEPLIPGKTPGVPLRTFKVPPQPPGKPLNWKEPPFLYGVNKIRHKYALYKEFLIEDSQIEGVTRFRVYNEKARLAYRSTLEEAKYRVDVWDKVKGVTPRPPDPPEMLIDGIAVDVPPDQTEWWPNPKAL